MRKKIEAKREKEGRKPYNICERTFPFAVRIVTLCLALQEKAGAHWVLSKQLLRSGTSVGANVEESQAAQSRADFVCKNSIARKEARETNYWLRLIVASGASSHPEIPELISESEQIVRILTSIIKTTKGVLPPAPALSFPSQPFPIP